MRRCAGAARCLLTHRARNVVHGALLRPFAVTEASVSTAAVVPPSARTAPGVVRETRRTEIAVADIKAALARERPRCTVHALGNEDHTLQLYAGLYALHRSGCIRLGQRHSRGELLTRLARLRIDEERLARLLANLFVEIDDVGLVFFDVRDSGGWFPEILDRVILYAKRSYRRSDHITGGAKVVPLGLNYSVYTDRASAAELTGALAHLDGSRLSIKRVLVALARIPPGAGAALGIPTLARLSSPPDPEAPPKAIFLARAWQPLGPDDDGFEALNEMRAGCIRALRAALGPDFLGGFARTELACRRYPDCVVGPGIGTRRREYLRLLRGYPVCVSTTGLYGSIGWKFGEYVALSKAIASEPLVFEVPGPMAPGGNYLEFTTPESCVTAVVRLLADADLRARMMARNHGYYAEYGAPDALVGRILHAALAA